MNTFWVLALTLGVVSADVGLNHDYKVPHTSYGVPSYQLHSTSGQNSGYTDSSIGYNYKQPVNKFVEHASTGEYSSTASTQKFGVPNYQTTTFQHGSPVLDLQNQPSYISNYGSSAGNTFVNSLPQHHSNNEYVSSAVQKYQQYYIQQQPAEIYRHFYIHSAPEEPELPKPRRPIVLPPPQKHYKIIFVKAPTESRQPQIVPVSPQSEEKTIVYVLVKKPEEQEVIVPKVEQKPPTKPEVYYIKYNDKHDSQAVIENIVNDYNNKGHVVTGTSNSYDNIYNANQQHGQSVVSTPGNFGGNVVSTLVQPPAPTPIIISGTSKGSASYGTTTTHHLTGHQPSSSLTTGGLSTGGHSTGTLSSNSLTTGGLTTGTLSSGGLTSEGLSTGTVTTGVLSEVPAVSSTTASTLLYDGANAISTSQGIPHETYGPPKFRPN